MTSPTLRTAAALADEQRRDLGAVEHGAAAHRQADARADEHAAEDRRQQQIVRDVGKVHRRDDDGQADDRQGAAQRERAPELPIPEHDERQVDDRQPHRERHRRRLRQQHRDAGDAAVDEMAGKEKPLEAHAGGDDAGDDQERRSTASRCNRSHAAILVL